MNTLELTQIVTAHQQAITRHEQWQAESEARLARIEAILEANAIQQQQNQQAIANLAIQQQQNQQTIANLAIQQQQNQQTIADLATQNRLDHESFTAQYRLHQEGMAELRASILELRNLVADYLQRRLDQ